MDVGHNPQCINRVFERLRKEYASENPPELITVFGCKKTKDFKEANSLLGELSDKVYFVRPAMGKG